MRIRLFCRFRVSSPISRELRTSEQWQFGMYYQYVDPCFTHSVQLRANSDSELGRAGRGTDLGMVDVLANRSYSEFASPGSGAVRLDDFLNPPPPPPPTPERQTFEAAVARVMRIRGLSRAEAERAAFETVLITRLNATHPNTDPSRCAHCARPETPDAALLPVGWGIRHARLHSDCRTLWRERRRAEAIAALAEAGVRA